MRQAVGVVRLIGADKFDKQDRQDVANWLKQQADDVLKDATKYDTHYLSTCMLERRERQ